MRAIIQARCQHKKAVTKFHCTKLLTTAEYTLNTLEKNILVDTDLELTSRKVPYNNIKGEKISLKQEV